MYSPCMPWWCTMQSCTFMHIMQFFQIKNQKVLKVILRKSFWAAQESEKVLPSFFVSASLRPRSFLIGGEGVGVRQRGTGGSAALCSPTALSRYSMLELCVSSCCSVPAGPSSRCVSLWLIRGWMEQLFSVWICRPVCVDVFSGSISFLYAAVVNQLINKCTWHGDFYSVVGWNILPPLVNVLWVDITLTLSLVHSHIFGMWNPFSCGTYVRKKRTQNVMKVIAALQAVCFPLPVCTRSHFIFLAFSFCVLFIFMLMKMSQTPAWKHCQLSFSTASVLPEPSNMLIMPFSWEN